MKVFKASVPMAAATLLMAVAPAAPAQAVTGWDRCQPGYFCAFTGTNGTGIIAQYQVGDPESLWNRTGSVWSVWRNIGGQEGWGIGPGAKLGTLHGSWPNNISVITRF